MKKKEKQKRLPKLTECNLTTKSLNMVLQHVLITIDTAQFADDAVEKVTKNHFLSKEVFYSQQRASWETKQ